MTTEIELPFATPLLNTTISEHWSKKTKRRKLYERYIWAATRSQHKGKALVQVFRHSSGTADNDGFVGGCKTLIDALVNQEVIVNDSPDWIGEPEYHQVKIGTREKAKTIIKITDI